MPERNIPPIEFKLKEKSNWDSTLIKFKSVAEGIAGEATWRKTDSRNNSDTNLTFLKCPGCTHVEYSSCKSFQTYDLDKKQKCNGCETVSCVKLWTCECGKFWHSCVIHRNMTCHLNNPSMKQETKRHTSQTANKQRTKHPRILGPSSYEELFAEDVRNAKRMRDEDDECSIEPNIILGIPRIKSIKVSSLGPILKRRFICG